MSGQIDVAKDDYSDKLIKLLPAEGIAALTTIKTMLETVSTNFYWLLGCAVIVGLFVFLWARLMRKVTLPLQLAFIMVAYLLWAMNIMWGDLTGAVRVLNQAPSEIPAIGSILFALFIPFVFPSPP